MADFRNVRPFPQPRLAAELTPEAQQYKGFKAKWKQRESSTVTDLGFSPVEPNTLGVCSGTKVAFWRAGKDGAATASGQVSKFKNITQCLAWRSDGKLLLAGEAGGSCAVVEMAKHSVLRRLRGHDDAVTCAAFAASDRARCATGSRDGKLRIWDVATSELLQTVEAHGDCMKAIAPGPGGPDGWITAGQDGKVKVWDLRGEEEGEGGGLAGGCVCTVDHGSPIEAGVAFPGGAMYVSVGGTEVKLWDLAAGGRLVQSLPDAHSKAITAVCLDSQATVLLTASFDGLAKVWRASSLEHLWTYRLPGPATSASWRSDGQAFALGFDDGSWQLREWRVPKLQGGKETQEAIDDAVLEAEDVDEIIGLTKADVGDLQKAEKVNKKRKDRDFMRGPDAEANDDDEMVDEGREKKHRNQGLTNYYFRKFEYRKCVELMMLPGTSIAIGTAIIDELVQRGALAKGMHELGEASCLSTLRWLLRAFGDGDVLQAQLLMEALHTLLDHNKCLQPPSTPQLLEAVHALERKVLHELGVQEVLMETAGMLKSVTAS